MFHKPPLIHQLLHPDIRIYSVESNYAVRMGISDCVAGGHDVVVSTTVCRGRALRIQVFSATGK